MSGLRSVFTNILVGAVVLGVALSQWYSVSADLAEMRSRNQALEAALSQADAGRQRAEEKARVLEADNQRLTAELDIARADVDTLKRTVAQGWVYIGALQQRLNEQAKAASQGDERDGAERTDSITNLGDGVVAQASGIGVVVTIVVLTLGAGWKHWSAGRSSPVSDDTGEGVWVRLTREEAQDVRARRQRHP